MANLYICSNGEKVNQRQINSRLSQMRKGMIHNYVCHCGSTKGTSWSHTIPQKECKYIHKTELIWAEENGRYECNVCHTQWENLKSMNYTNHKGWLDRMAYCAEHAPEYFRRRLAAIEDPKILKQIIDYVPDDTVF